MSSYCAFLGHQPIISIAELAAALPGFAITHTFAKDIITFETERTLTQEDLDLLGGTIIIAQQVSDHAVEFSDLPQLLLGELEGMRGKLTFSLRSFQISPKDLRNAYRACKDAIKKIGRTCRYVGNEKKAVISVVLHNEGLIDGSHGCEMVILKDEENLWIGRTVAAHNPDAYTERDIGKPVRDTTVGLLPPKLAQVMLNLGSWLAEKPVLPPQKEKKRGKPKKEEIEAFIVMDPFCGTGVIPMECLLRKWSVIASDSSQKAVSGCEKNLDWLRKKEGIGKKDVPSTVSKHDAVRAFDFSKIRDTSLRDGPHVIVTETSLGPGMKKRPMLTEAKKLRSDNEKLQKEFLQNIASTVPGVPVVMMLPVWYSQKGAIYLEKVWDIIEKLGYTPVLPEGTSLHKEGRTALLYRRPDQFVGREILLLTPPA